VTLIAQALSTNACQEGHTNYRELPTKTGNYWQFTDNFRQVLLTDNRQGTLKHTDKIPTSTIYRQILTTRWTFLPTDHNGQNTDKYYFRQQTRNFVAHGQNIDNY